MTEQATANVVRHSVTVPVARERAFRLFTEEIGSWWPTDTHKLSEGPITEVFEPRQGGRWYELGVDGSECAWGEVLVYEPPSRIVLTWQIAGDWQLDEAASEVEVTFTATGGGTRVELEHRHFDRLRLGDAMREQVAGDGGWGGLLARYSEAVG
jgi:uncharacterized protein YndB with AHSA1/START domain